jgi:NADH:ubiquinone reductase (non-electrogenic)
VLPHPPLPRSSGGREAPPLPATAQVAFQQADYVAWNLWASINGKPLLNFR